ncbi:hypothetical protein F4810DRAFT_509792 [Camillea tinctor]|nr:hypothetical protein F4810DRAFT_509792 [Camillea tinctor]
MALSWIRKLPPYAQEIVLDGPAMLPPVGVMPVFDDPPNRNVIGYVTNGICIAALLAVVLIRGYAKLFCIRKVEIEDYIALAAVGAWAGCIWGNYWFIENYGVFVHQWNIRIRDMTRIMRTVHIVSNLAAANICLVKTAILIEWDRIFVPRGTRNYFFWTLRVILAIHVLFHVSWILAENLGCTPYRRIWDQTIAEGKCINQKVLYIPAAIVNLITDFVVLLLPQKVIWKLQLSRRNKIGVSVVFAVGIFSCIGASFRLVESVRFFQSDDLFYALASMDHWILVEMTCQFVVFCAPTTPIVFRGLGGATAKEAPAGSKSWANLASKPSNPEMTSFARVPRVVSRVFDTSRKSTHDRRHDSDESLWSSPYLSNVPLGIGPTTEITVQSPLARVRAPEGILRTTRIVHQEEYVDSPSRGTTSSGGHTPTF